MRYLRIILLTVLSLMGANAVAQYTPPPVTVSTEVIRNEKGEFFVHKVEMRQTLFSIAKAYNADVNQITADNPLLKGGLKAGDIVLIRKAGAPAQEENRPSEAEQKKEIKYTQHLVRWYETIESIALKYKITAEELVALNKLTDSELRPREILLIPDGKGDNSVPSDNNPAGNERGLFSKSVANNHVVSLILPFNARNYEANPGTNNYLDFYQGFLIAANDAKEKGMNLRLKVIDNKEYQNSSLIASSGRIDGSGLVIGPVFADEISGLLDYTREKAIPLISPMDPSSDKFVEGNPQFLQVSVPVEIQQEALISSILPDSHVALFCEEGTQNSEQVNITRSILNSKGIQYTFYSYALLKGRSVHSQLVSKLNRSKENSVIILSNSEAFVSDILRNLNLINTRDGYKITLFGTPRWRNFDNVDIDYYHSMNLHLALQYNVDYSGEDVSRFLSRYRAMFGSEPSPYAFQAYDLGNFFLSSMMKYGEDFIDYIDEEPKTGMLQSSYRFERSKRGSGFINKGVRLIIYRPDYSIETRSFGR